MQETIVLHDPELSGRDSEEGIVAIELKESPRGDRLFVYKRDGEETVLSHDRFCPFILTAADVAKACPHEFEASNLNGEGSLNVRMDFSTWRECLKAKSWISKERTGAPYLFVNDPVQQYLISSGKTLFKGMGFDVLRRMQVDIECVTTEGYEFCNAGRAGDEIVIIAMADQTGWNEVLCVNDVDEKSMLERFVEIVRERDPDVIEGHNIFNFDLPYIQERARRHGVKLAIGRDGSVPRVRPSRFSAGERTIAYKRFDVFGRHILDTLFMAHIYDISHRSLNGFGLKEVAVHFGLAGKDRTYIDGMEITSQFRSDPAKVLKYALDDVKETGALSTLLSRSSFIQTQMLPYSYQNACVRGNATKIDALMIREYMRQGHALPLPGPARDFSGGYTDMFETGVIKNVHHCDIRSLYPSLMLSGKISPDSDELGVFLRLLERLRALRLDAKKKMTAAKTREDHNYYDTFQSVFKVLINSFYGYLGFSQGHFNDYSAAERVTAGGRELLAGMIEWLKKNGARPVEIDTDGIYFVPPEFGKSGSGWKDLDDFRSAFEKWLPPGIDVDFDGEYASMYSYKMKNYALLAEDGEVIIKGAALKSRGMEPFQREFLERVIRLKLAGEAGKISALKKEYEDAILSRKWPITMFAKTETLQDSPQTYEAKMERGEGARRAVYNLALRSGRQYGAGDQISYYVTGSKKSVAVHENSKLISEWNPSDRDENIAYYLAKLDALNTKFGVDDVQQGELAL